MATKSGARHRPTLPSTLLLVLAALLGVAVAGCGNDVSETVGPAARTPPAPPGQTAGPGTAWPSYPLPDQVPPTGPDGWPTLLPTTPVPDRSPEASPDVAGPTGPAGGVGGADPFATRSSIHATGPDQATDRRPEGYQRSLVYSGLLGLVIAAIGLTMVGRRRRLW